MSVSGISSTLLYRIGQAVAGSSVKKNQESSVLESALDALSTPVPSPAGCGGSDATPVKDKLQDGGIPTHQPDGGDGGLPTKDDDNTHMELNPFSFPPLGGPAGTQGSRFVEASNKIEVESGIITGKGVQDLDEVVVGVGVDSTLIGPTEENPDIPTMPEEGCFSPARLIDVTPVSKEYWEMGFGCHSEENVTYENEPYREFLVCPPNENWGQDLYLAWAQLKCYDKDGDIIHDTGRITRSTIAQIEQGNGERLGVICGNYPLSEFIIPKECYHRDFDRDGLINARLSVGLYLVNRQSNDETADRLYQTYMWGKTYAR